MSWQIFCDGLSEEDTRKAKFHMYPKQEGSIQRVYLKSLSQKQIMYSIEKE
jgi:hypothetical protein